MRGRTTCRVSSSRACTSFRASPIRRWGTAKGGSTCRSAAFSSAPSATAALIDFHFRDDAISAAPSTAAVPSPRTQIGSPACCDRARRSNRIAASTRPICAPTGSPNSCCSTPSFRIRCGLPPSAWSRRCGLVAQRSPRGLGGRVERLAGRLHASLDYGQVDEILSDNPHRFLDGIARQCQQIHNAVHQTYIAYPIETAIPA